MYSFAYRKIIYHIVQNFVHSICCLGTWVLYLLKNRYTTKNSKPKLVKVQACLSPVSHTAGLLLILLVKIV